MDLFGNNKPKAYGKVKDIIKYVLYYEDDEQKLGAVTKSKKLNDYNLRQILTDSEYSEIINYLENGVNQK